MTVLSFRTRPSSGPSSQPSYTVRLTLPIEERFLLVAAMAQGLVLDSAADLVEMLVRLLHPRQADQQLARARVAFNIAGVLRIEQVQEPPDSQGPCYAPGTATPRSSAKRPVTCDLYCARRATARLRRSRTRRIH